MKKYIAVKINQTKNENIIDKFENMDFSNIYVKANGDIEFESNFSKLEMVKIKLESLINDGYDIKYNTQTNSFKSNKKISSCVEVSKTKKQEKKDILACEELLKTIKKENKSKDIDNKAIRLPKKV